MIKNLDFKIINGSRSIRARMGGVYISHASDPPCVTLDNKKTNELIYDLQILIYIKPWLINYVFGIQGPTVRGRYLLFTQSINLQFCNSLSFPPPTFAKFKRRKIWNRCLKHKNKDFLVIFHKFNNFKFCILFKFTSGFMQQRQRDKERTEI